MQDITKEVKELKEKFLNELPEGQKKLFNNLNDNHWNAFYDNYQKGLKENKELENKIGDLLSLYQSYFPDHDISIKKEECILKYDSVVYSFSNIGNIKLTKDPLSELQHRLEHSKLHFDISLNKYHSLIKDVFNFLNPKTENLTCMIGGGLQIQIFFKNDSGYLATLYLDLNTDIDHKLKDKYSMVINGIYNNKLFKDFKHKNINLSKEY